MNQLPLLPHEIEIADQARRRAHRDDPITSLLAAREMVASGAIETQLRAVLAALRRHPGLTRDELARVEAGDPAAFARRLPELVALGFAYQGARRKSAISGRMAVTWWPVGGAL